MKKMNVCFKFKKSNDRKKFQNRFSMGKIVYGIFLCVMLFIAYQPVYAAPKTDTTTTNTGTTTIWTKANEIMKDVYNQIVIISTVTAIVTVSIALLMMNFSRNGKTVDESRAWLKRICISWAILNGLGFIMAYITPFFANGKWTG